MIMRYLFEVQYLCTKYVHAPPTEREWNDEEGPCQHLPTVLAATFNLHSRDLW
jgi:hypothetical protein